jgi:hypothetical protein
LQELREASLIRNMPCSRVSQIQRLTQCANQSGPSSVRHPAR